MLNDLTAIKALEAQIEDLKKQINDLKNEQIKSRRMSEDLMYNLDSDNVPSLKDGMYLARVINGTTQAIIKADHITLEGMNIDLTGKNITISSDNFNVDEEGNLTCQNAVVRGQIFATGGTFDDGSISNADIDTATIGNANILHTCHLLSDGTQMNTLDIGPQKEVGSAKYGTSLMAHASEIGGVFTPEMLIESMASNGYFAAINTLAKSDEAYVEVAVSDGGGTAVYQFRSDGLYLNGTKVL